MSAPLYIVKVGSATVMSSGQIWDDIAVLHRGGARVLVVAGGGEFIRAHYKAIRRVMPFLTLRSGDQFRHCTADEMTHIVAAYDSLVLPAIDRGIRGTGERVLAFIAGRNNLVTGRRSKPLRAVVDSRDVLVRDSRVGQFAGAETDILLRMLDGPAVVCLVPPIADAADGGWLNIDADMLAANLAIAMDADHLRFVTGTPGLLRDLGDPASNVQDVYPDDELPFVLGRMKQKVRAARHAAHHMSGDVAVTGPHRLTAESTVTWFWAERPPMLGFELLTQAVAIASTSGDEAELARHLYRKARGIGLDARLDAAGNLVVTKGHGLRRLMLMSHLDTVPFRWPTRWLNGSLTGRGSVDAKPSLINFLETAIAAEVPSWGQLIIIGATEEEASSSKGAFYVRDNYAADAVIIGEPSGAAAVTLGYFGLLKVDLCAVIQMGHSAGKGIVTAIDVLVKGVTGLRAAIGALDPSGLSSFIDAGCSADKEFTHARGVLNFRVSPGADVSQLVATVNAYHEDGLTVSLLRATPASVCPRTGTLPRAFARAFARTGTTPRYLVKKGTADMNTLATTWSGIEFVAYGPGDSSLDHTPYEAIKATEYELSRVVLGAAVNEWFHMAREKGDPV